MVIGEKYRVLHLPSYSWYRIIYTVSGAVWRSSAFFWFFCVCVWLLWTFDRFNLNEISFVAALVRRRQSHPPGPRTWIIVILHNECWLVRKSGVVRIGVLVIGERYCVSLLLLAHGRIRSGLAFFCFLFFFFCVWSLWTFDRFNLNERSFVAALIRRRQSPSRTAHLDYCHIAL